MLPVVVSPVTYSPGHSILNYQGIVKCNTTVTNLNRHENYFVVYNDNVFNNYREFIRIIINH